MVVHVADVIIFRDDKVLLVKPTYTTHYALPGGHVDAGETPVQAARREVKEETGLDIDIIRNIAVNVETSAAGGLEGINFLFHGKPRDMAAEVQVDGAEIERFEWVSPEKVAGVLHPLVGAAFAAAYAALIEGRTVYLEDGKTL